MKLPMREKYVDERVGIWFVFGQRQDGGVDISDGTRDVWEGLPPAAAAAACEAQERFREELYRILCDKKPAAPRSMLPFKEI